MAHWANMGLPMGFRGASLCGCASTDDDVPVTLIGGDDFLVPMKHDHERIPRNQSDGAGIEVGRSKTRQNAHHRHRIWRGSGDGWRDGVGGVQ